MSSAPLVTVIVPTYNRGRQIAACVESVLNQTYPHLEILVVDDCSTDDTVDRLPRLPRLTSRHIRLLQMPRHSGANACRNLGYAESKGEYIQFLDSDDTLHPHKLSIQAKFLARFDSLDVVFCLSRSYSEEPGHISTYWNLPCYSDYVHEFLMSNPLWHTNDALWQRRFLDALSGPWNHRLVCWQDWEFHLRALLAGAQVMSVPQTLAYFQVATPNNSANLCSTAARVHSRLLAGESVSNSLCARGLERHYARGLLEHYLLLVEETLADPRLLPLQRRAWRGISELARRTTVSADLHCLVLPAALAARLSLPDSIRLPVAYRLFSFLRRLYPAARSHTWRSVPAFPDLDDSAPPQRRQDSD